MTREVLSSVPVPPWGLAVAAMVSVQLGSALSVDLIASVGSGGTAWLRLSMGALIFMILARPPLRAVRRHDAPALLGLGVATGVVIIAFLAAIDRIPLGTAVAIEFLGPLTVAAVRSQSRRALTFPSVALIGVVPLTEPWRDEVNLAGISAFGTLMAFEPSIGVVLGLLVLQQEPSTTQIVGLVLVVLAGAAAQHGGRRQALTR